MTNRAMLVRAVTRSANDDARRVGRDLILELAHEIAARFALDGHGTLRVTAACPDCSADHGRPVILDDDGVPGRISVSVAHAGAVTVAAAAIDCTVGIDAETEPAAERRAAIVAVASDGGDGAVADPLLHWLRVEAVLKADGRGLRVDPRRVRVRESGAAAIASIDGEEATYEVAEVDIHRDVRACVATRVN